MEVRIEEYGKMMFQIMTSENSHSEHWESIRKEAEPLVKELIKLNNKMKGGGYKIVGYRDDSGKMNLPTHRRIEIAQEKLWMIKASKLKRGDKIWLFGDEPEMHIGEQSPAIVEDVTKEAVYVEMHDWENYTKKLGKDYEVLKAPKDWEENEDLYSSEKYWLKQADKLGI